MFTTNDLIDMIAPDQGTKFGVKVLVGKKKNIRFPNLCEVNVCLMNI